MASPRFSEDDSDLEYEINITTPLLEEVKKDKPEIEDEKSIEMDEKSQPSRSSLQAEQKPSELKLLLTQLQTVNEAIDLIDDFVKNRPMEARKKGCLVAYRLFLLAALASAVIGIKIILDDNAIGALGIGLGGSLLIVSLLLECVIRCDTNHRNIPYEFKTFEPTRHRKNGGGSTCFDYRILVLNDLNPVSLNSLRAIMAIAHQKAGIIFEKELYSVRASLLQFRAWIEAQPLYQEHKALKKFLMGSLSNNPSLPISRSFFHHPFFDKNLISLIESARSGTKPKVFKNNLK